MTTLESTLLITATALCGFSWAIIAYSGYATLRGWQIGVWYSADFSWLQGIAYLTLLASLVFGYLAVGWWGPLVVLLGGNILTRLLLPASKESTQLIAPAAVLLFGVVCTAVSLYW